MEVQSKKETLKYLKGCDLEYLEKHTIGIDRGVAIPIQAGNQSFDFSQTQKKKTKLNMLGILNVFKSD